MFLSDIVTADVKFIEEFARKRSDDFIRSNLAFPKEDPVDSDWESWIIFWRSWTLDNFKIPLPLGAWKAQSHRIWEWFMNENDSVLYRSREDGRHNSYVKRLDRGQKFHLHSVVMEVENLRPVSVRIFVDGRVRLQSVAKLVTKKKKD